jgi:hypothetical protein
MAAPEVVEYFLRWAYAPVGNVVQALPDGLINVRPGGRVEQTLVRLGVLDNGLGLPSDSEDERSFALSETSDELARIAAETRQRLDVFGDVEHGDVPLKSKYDT